LATLTDATVADEKDNDDKPSQQQQQQQPSLWTQLQSPPNLITLSRMASTPLLSYWIVHHEFGLALGGCCVAALSDYMDGYIAKTYHMSTTVGTYFDPLADKIVINVLAMSLWFVGGIPTPLVALWITRDVGLLAATGYHLQQNQGSANFLATSVLKEPLQVEPTMLGKVNTVLQSATLGVALMEPILLGTTISSDYFLRDNDNCCHDDNC
jgi:cardiolipin synthase